jgi:hypothetical protein
LLFPAPTLATVTIYIPTLNIMNHTLVVYCNFKLQFHRTYTAVMAKAWPPLTAFYCVRNLVYFNYL